MKMPNHSSYGAITLLLIAITWMAAGSVFVSAPIIMLTNPPPNRIYGFPSVVRLKADASSSDSSITQVQFYEASTNLLGTVTQPPYYLFLTNVLLWRSEYYLLTAVAMNARGLTATSAPVQVLITQGATPLVLLDEPKGGQVFLTNSIVVFTGKVDPWDGSENPMRFFSGETLIGTAQAPLYTEVPTLVVSGGHTNTKYLSVYTLAVTNLPIGQQIVSAKYRNGNGGLSDEGTSAGVPITVTPLSLSAAEMLLNKQFRFTLSGALSGRDFQIEASTNLPAWFPIATNTATSEPFQFTDPNAAGFSFRFYRAVQKIE